MDSHHEGPSLEEMTRQRLPYIAVLSVVTVAVVVLAALIGVGVLP